MPPHKPKTAAITAPKGTKKTFDDDDVDNTELDFNAASSSRSTLKGNHRQTAVVGDDESDSDDAPEAVGMSAGKQMALDEIEKAKRSEKAKKDAIRLRAQKIAESKQKELEKRVRPQLSKGKKRKVEMDEDDDEEEDVDEETRRLRARMQKAMDDGEGDSDIEAGSSDIGDSFHTDTEDENEDDDDEADENEDDEDDEDDADEDDEEEDEDDEEEDDESETLEDGPLDDATRLMRERMQAAMEAAERRAGIVHPTKKATQAGPKVPPASTSSAPTTASKAGKSMADPDDASAWDMSVGVGGPQPLSAAALRRAEEEEQEIRRQKKEKARIKAEKRKAAEKDVGKKKKRKVTEATSRDLGDGRVAKLLEPTLDPSAGGLPPVIDAGRKMKGQAAGQASQRKFVKRAMKFSGQLSGKTAVDGRRKPMGLEMRS